MLIDSISAIEVLDSRGMPTVGCKLVLYDGSYAFTSVPSGASTGKYEACELRDGDKSRYFGKGVQQAVGHINGELTQCLVGKSFATQADFDQFICNVDGSVGKKRLGANALLALSQAYCKACAMHDKLPLFLYLAQGKSVSLPVPFMNVINGGAHAENALCVQECMIVPHGFTSFKDAIRAGAEVHHTLAQVFNQKSITYSRGDEGGYAPDLHRIEDAFACMLLAIEQAGYHHDQIAIAVDFAGSSFFENGLYTPDDKSYSQDKWVDYLTKLCDNYPIISLEDALDEDDWSTWQVLHDAIGDRVQLVGDDLFVTQVSRLSRGIKDQAANAVLIKPNQVGTVTETIDTIVTAQQHGFGTMVSHRSGETEDVFIADLCVAMGSGQIKTGPTRQQDRVSKYNRLLWIESLLAEKACYQSDALARYTKMFV